MPDILDKTAIELMGPLAECRDHLCSLGAPQASKLGERIGELMLGLIDAAEDVAAYYDKWASGEPSAAMQVQSVVWRFNRELRT